MAKFLLLLVASAVAAAAAVSAAPTSAPTITSSTHQPGVPANESIAHFSWSAPTGGASPHYLHALTPNATTAPLDTDNLTDQTATDVLLPATGQWYFHVVAFDQDGRSPAAHYGPVSRNLTVQQRCAAAFGGGEDTEGANEGALADCIAAAQNQVAPQAIMALFLAFLAKFGSATLRRG